MPAPTRTVRTLASICAVASLAVAGLAVTAAPAAAQTPPKGAKVTVRNSSTAILSWGAASQATQYEVQVDTTADFASPDYSAKTQNTKAVPTKSLIPGKNYWRVRALGKGSPSKWVTGSFTVAPVTTPIPLAPTDGAVLAQPQNPPLLQWSSSQGAVSYKVEVDGDADLIGAKVYTTKTTSLVVPDPLTTGDWYWRVTADKGSGLVSLPSTVSRFDISPLALPQITYPADSVNQAIEDVVLDWTPVPGAKTYDVQVALDDDFNNIALDVKNVFGSRYSPPVTLANDQFWWRVRAVDLSGQPTPWTESLYGFQRQWLDQPQPVYPIGTVTTDRPYIQWTPVQHASKYELYVAQNPQMTVGLERCRVAGTTYVPRSVGDCGISPNVDLWWEVRAMDDPYQPSLGLPGVFSTPQAFRWTGPAPGPFSAIDLNTVVSGLKVAVNGGGITDPGKGCKDPVSDPNVAYICTGVPTTPVFSWDPVPGAMSYHVDVAQDVNFTTSEMPDGIDTDFPMMALEWEDERATLPESQAGSAYYWHVTACGTNGCTQSPVSRFPPLPGSEAFRKASPAITGLQSSDPNASEITFSWQDYYDTNVGTVWNGETGSQTARQYRIQVDNEPSFATPVDTKVVDQATYTAYDKLYPDGTYWWRVQAVDPESFGLTWSPVQTFTKTSPPVVPSSPVGGASVSGTTPFRWAAQAFAGSYAVEVYKNNDLSFSAANKVFSATVKTAAVAPTTPIPAAASAYVWRVRRIDTDGNPGPWSTPATFYSTGVAPNLLAPKAGVWVKFTAGLFEWTEVPGAATYQVNLYGDHPTKASTVATAWAPTSLASGKYTWNVTALDAAGNALATSATRAFKVDASLPELVSLNGQVVNKGTKVDIRGKFSEKVKGVSASSIKLYKAGSKKEIKAKVTLGKDKKSFRMVTKGSRHFKIGEKYDITFSAKIRDFQGNKMIPGVIHAEIVAKRMLRLAGQ